MRSGLALDSEANGKSRRGMRYMVGGVTVEVGVRWCGILLCSFRCGDAAYEMETRDERL